MSLDDIRSGWFDARVEQFGVVAIAKSPLLFHRKRRFDDGAIMEMTLWLVPKPVVGATHRLKYNLFYGTEGERLVGYDNERGKGDHRHYPGIEELYVFTSPEQLISDFLAEVRQLRGDDM